MTFPMGYRKKKFDNFFLCCAMTPVVWSVKCTIGGKILGSDPNLTFYVLIILLTKFYAFALKWSEKTQTELTISIQGEMTRNWGDMDELFDSQFKYEVDKSRKNSISKIVSCRKINNWYHYFWYYLFCCIVSWHCNGNQSNQTF